MRSRFLLFVLVILSTLSACNYPVIPDPSGDGPSTHAPVIQTVSHTETFTSIPATSNEVPSATPAGTSTALFSHTPTITPTWVSTNVVDTPTLMPWKIPANTPLPPLPDYDKSLTTGGAAGPNLYILCKYDLLSGKTPPAVAGRIIFYNETAYLCLWGTPLDVPFQVELVSPNGELKLKGVFQATSQPNELLWSGHISEAYDNMVVTHEAPSLVVIHLWWPTDLPAGAWQIQVNWAEGETHGFFDAGTAEYYSPAAPRIRVRDSRTTEEILPVHPSSIVIFHPGNTQEIHGAGFERNSVVYLLVYAATDVTMGLRFSFVTGTPVLTDNEGGFVVGFPANLEKGRRYMALAVVDPQAKLVIDPEELGFPALWYDYLNNDAIEAKDYFYIQPADPSVTP